jgi:hypothetical protein
VVFGVQLLLLKQAIQVHPSCMLVKMDTHSKPMMLSEANSKFFMAEVVSFGTAKQETAPLSFSLQYLFPHIATTTWDPSNSKEIELSKVHWSKLKLKWVESNIGN